MKRIIVGIDGSPLGWQALDRAADLAVATSAGLRLVNVTAPLNSNLAVEDYGSVMVNWRAAQESYAKGLLREATARVSDKRLDVDTVSCEGPAAEMLAEVAQSPDATMVVVGHRGRNLAARLFVGSVADRLVQISSKPVLVVR